MAEGQDGAVNAEPAGKNRIYESRYGDEIRDSGVERTGVEGSNTNQHTNNADVRRKIMQPRRKREWKEGCKMVMETKEDGGRR